MKLLAAFITFALFSFLTTPTFAQTPTAACQPIFGGGPTCVSSGNLILNKTIKNPKTGEFVDTLPTDVRFTANQDIQFRLTVTNNNNGSLSKVTITDTFSKYLTLTGTGGAGTFNTESSTLTITIDKLAGNETKVYTISARVKGTDALPQNQTCLVNQAQVKVGTRKGSDNVQYCIGGQTTTQTTRSTQTPATPPVAQQLTVKPPVPTSTTNAPVYPTPQTGSTPNTGPEILGLIGLLPLGATGLFLRKKTPNS